MRSGHLLQRPLLAFVVGFVSWISAGRRDVHSLGDSMGMLFRSAHGLLRMDELHESPVLSGNITFRTRVTRPSEKTPGQHAQTPTDAA
jgi:hypothetical protein